MYAGIKIETGDMVGLSLVDGNTVYSIIYADPPTSDHTYLSTFEQTEQEMVEEWRTSSIYSLVELKDFTMPTLLDALKEVALDQLEKHGEA